MKSPFFVLLTMSLVAAPALTEAQETPPLPEKTVILPRGYRPSSAPLSPAILVGNTLYLSGNTGGDPETGRLVDGGLARRAHLELQATAVRTR